MPHYSTEKREIMDAGTAIAEAVIGNNRTGETKRGCNDLLKVMTRLSCSPLAMHGKSIIYMILPLVFDKLKRYEVTI